MGLRGFGTQTLTGSPQPLFGTTLSAAVLPSPDPNTGRLDPGSMPSSTVLPLAAPSYIFRVGDHVAIGPTSAFLPPNQNPSFPPDGGTVQQILSASSILVTGLLRKHSAAEWVVLAIPCAQINIQNGSGTIYLGEDSTVGVTSLTLIETATASGQITIGWPALGNMIETQHLWVEGSGTYLPYLMTI